MNIADFRVSDARRGAALSGLLALFVWPSFAQPAGIYSRTLDNTPPAAVQCAEAAADAGNATRTDLATCTIAIGEARSVKMKAASLTNRAILHRRSGAVDRAVDDCRRALDLVQDDPHTAVTCAAVYINAGQPRAAVDLLEASPLPTPGLTHKYYHNLALAHHDLGEYAEAYDYLEKTLEAKPGFAPAVALKAQYKVARE